MATRINPLQLAMAGARPGTLPKGSGGLSVNAASKPSFGKTAGEQFSSGFSVMDTFMTARRAQALKARQLDQELEEFKFRREFDTLQHMADENERRQQREQDIRTHQLAVRAQGETERAAKQSERLRGQEIGVSQGNLNVSRGRLTLEQDQFNDEQEDQKLLENSRFDALNRFRREGKIGPEIDISAVSKDPTAYEALINRLLPKPTTTGRYVKAKDEQGNPRWFSAAEAAARRLEPVPGQKPYESTGDKERAKAAIKTESQVFDGALKAQANNNDLNRLANMFEGLYTGVGGDAVLFLQKLGSALGVEEVAGSDLTTSAGRKEAGEAIAKKMALTLRNPADGAGLPGQMSNQDRDYLRAMIPGLATTAEGRRLMIEAMRKVNDRKVLIAEKAKEYLMNNDYLDAKFKSEIIEFNKNNPIFSRQDQASLDKEIGITKGRTGGEIAGAVSTLENVRNAEAEAEAARNAAGASTPPVAGEPSSPPATPPSPVERRDDGSVMLPNGVLLPSLR